MIETLLIAGRGEASRRFERTCERLGIELSAGSQDNDGVAAPDINELLAVAKRTGAAFVHPGSLSPVPRAELASAAEEAGLTFVGAPVQALQFLADKSAMRRAAISTGMGVVPGTGPHSNVSEVGAVIASGELGDYPFVLKPNAGAGGEGIFLAHDETELEAAFASAAKAGQELFADGRVLVEVYLPRAREIEVTVAVGPNGVVASLPERETSLRWGRRPWLIESPSPLFSLQRGGDQLQEALVESVIELAKAFGTVGVATFEFLIDPAGRYFFLEANAGCPRAHLLTELASDLDIHELEIQIASGGAAMVDGPVKTYGHGFEALVHAHAALEDPVSPAPASTVRFPPTAVRKARGEPPLEAVGANAGGLVARAATSGPVRHQALLQLDRFLAETSIEPGPSNLAALRAALGNESFRAGQYDLSFGSRFSTRDGRAGYATSASS